jgi:hypothetical protein
MSKLTFRNLSEKLISYRETITKSSMFLALKINFSDNFERGGGEGGHFGTKFAKKLRERQERQERQGSHDLSGNAYSFPIN